MNQTTADITSRNNETFQEVNCGLLIGHI